MIKHLQNLFNHLKDYKMFAILLLGFSAGIPYALIGSTLSMWISRAGLDIKTIGLFAMISIPFSFKFLWAFLFDHIPLPYVSKKFGFRKSWLILSQICLIAAIIALGNTSPTENIILTAAAALLVAFCSATQDIIIDALRIEVLEEEDQAIGASLYVYGYRLAIFVSGAGSLLLANHISWNLVFFVMAATILVGIVAVIFLQEPSYSKKRLANLQKVKLSKMFYALVVKPLLDFCNRPQWVYILLFIVFYKFSDTLLASLQSKFYVDMGFSNSEIAYISKGFGFIMTLLGLFIGGVIYFELGIFKSLFLAGLLQILSNLVFIWVAEEQHNIMALSVAIAVENFTGAINNVVIIAYLSSLCNIAYTATQYALLSSLSTVGRTMMSAPSGYIVDAYGWINFFWITAAVGIPALILLFIIFKDPKHANT